MAVLRAPISLMRLILLRCIACLALSLARSRSCLLSPLLATRMLTAPPRNPLSHDSSSSRRAGSMGTITSRGTGEIGANKSCRSLRSLVACARATASVAVTICVDPMALRCSVTTVDCEALIVSPAVSEYTCTIRSAISSSSVTSSTRSTLQLRSPRMEPART